MTCTFVITSKTWGLKIFDTHFSKTWLCLVPKFQYFTAIVHFGDIVQGETSRLLVLNQLTLKALEKAVSICDFKLSATDHSSLVMVTNARHELPGAQICF